MKLRRTVAATMLVLAFHLSTARAQLSPQEFAAAEADLLTLVAPAEVPLLGNFFSWQKPWQPPLPFAVFRELDVYDLGPGRFLLDDRLVEYPPPLESSSSPPTSLISVEAYGCGLWLEIARATNSASNVVVTLHNTVGAGSYNLWSKQQLAATNTWTLETNITGASGQGSTAVTLAMSGRSNLFLKATTAAFFTNKSFAGLQYSNAIINPPDTMGAVGLEHFLEILNIGGGPASVAVFDKCTGAILQTAISWMYITNSEFRDYFDLDDGAVTAPQADTPLRLDLHTVGSRLSSAVMRNGAMWTGHHVGLSGTNGNYSGDETGTAVDRTAAQWLKFQIDTNGNFLSITNGRIYDGSSSDPRWYYYPSLMVNKADDMVISFSGAKAAEYVGAYYSWRSAAGAVARQPECLAIGQGPVPQDRWGDYSHTTLDPYDSIGFWTIQQFSGSDLFDYPWGTWIGQILLPFPP